QLDRVTAGAAATDLAVAEAAALAKARRQIFDQARERLVRLADRQAGDGAARVDGAEVGLGIAARGDVHPEPALDDAEFFGRVDRAADLELDRTGQIRLAGGRAGEGAPAEREGVAAGHRAAACRVVRRGRRRRERAGDLRRGLRAVESVCDGEAS